MNKRGHVLNGLLLGIGLGYILEPAGDVTTFVKVVEVAPPIVLGAMLPDIDTEFGKHRKLLHNLPVLVAFYAFPAFFGNLSWVWIGILSHYVLDVVGSTRGIALFYPYPEEFGLPTGVTVSSNYAQWATVAITAAELGAFFAVVFYDLPVVGLGETGDTFQVSLPALL